jgi:prenyltransferase beta subunit
VSLKSELLQAARRARGLRPDAAARALAFLRRQAHPEGGWCDRAGQADLYYTVFALTGIAALEAEIPADAVARCLAGFGDGRSLDLVHLACLARCASLAHPEGPPAKRRRAMVSHLETYRSEDGGYGPVPGSPRGAAYACYLALGAAEDLGAAAANPEGMARCLRSLRADDGSWGPTPATAGAAEALRDLGQLVEASTVEWLLARQAPEGGFGAFPDAPGPDLLSTATALHGLAAAGTRLEGTARDACRRFVLSLHAPDGGFRGYPADDRADCEYTFYGLLALGHLE